MSTHKVASVTLAVHVAGAGLPLVSPYEISVDWTWKLGNGFSVDKQRQTFDNKDIRPFQGRGTVAHQRNGGGFFH
jgi:hypothetical protein